MTKDQPINWEHLVRAAIADVGAARSAGVLPERIGRYRILSCLGRGGMGVVYQAEQENPRRVVALKIVRPERATLRWMRRFEREAQALARLQHPGIAQIYEAGFFETSAGPQPYFAMELVTGRPLVEFIKRENLDIPARLELLARVCDAVLHAHQKGIIHCDLKPDNILVAAEGIEELRDSGIQEKQRTDSAFIPQSLNPSIPQPKILDFGLARIIDPDAPRMSTESHGMIGTLPYMSPEQVKGDPNELDTRSDIYALGVIGYEMLTECLPYDTARKSPPEIARIMREQDPRRLSSHNRRLRGDVETIIHKALEHDRIRRYRTADALAADLRRYLADEPIAAQPPSVWYQLSKFAKRYKGLVFGLVGTVAALVIGFIFSLVLYAQAEEARAAEKKQREAAQTNERRADREREEAVAARNAEAAERKKAQQAQGETAEALRILKDMLAGVRPSVALGRDTAMLEEMLDATAKRIEESELQAVPKVELQLRLILGDTYRQIANKGAYDKAERMLRPALDLARMLYLDDHSDAALSLNDWAKLLYERGDWAAAEPLFRKALEINRCLFPGDHPDVANSLNNLALLLQARGDLTAAEPLFREALEMFRKVSPPNYGAIGNTTVNLGRCLLGLQRFAEAEPLLLEAGPIFRQAQGVPKQAMVGDSRALIDLYEAWHAAAPDKGYDQKAAAWRVKLAEWQTAAQPGEGDE